MKFGIDLVIRTTLSNGTLINKIFVTEEISERFR